MLKSILLIREYENWTSDGEKYPATEIRNDKINDSNMTPIVIGILINLKFKYIKAAEIVTRREDISNIFNTNHRNHQNQSYHPLHQDRATYL